MSKSLSFYTATTPNNRRVSIFLEELKAAYGFSYEVTKAFNLFAGEHKKDPSFLKINPNAKVPVIIDHANGDFILSESAAILLYLESHYDKEGKFGFKEGTNEYFEALKWLLFIHSGMAPDAGSYFMMNRSDEKPPVAMERALNSVKSALSVLETHLATGKEYLVGNKYSIVDINAFPFIATHAYFGIQTLDEWPNVKAWTARIAEREQVKKGLNVPPNPSY